MRFLLDQNLSHRLRDLLADIYPEIVHVRDVGLHAADDGTVWRYAEQNGLTIVSKDADFRQRSFLFGHPPKVVWLRQGNASTTGVEMILRVHHRDLSAFMLDEDNSFLVLG